MRIDGSKEAFTMPIMSRPKNDSPQPDMDQAPMGSARPDGKGQAPGREISEEAIFKQVADANYQLKAYDRRLEFSIHDATHKVMVKVINTNDDSVIREIPSEKALDMLAYVWKLTGILVDEKR